MNWYEPRSASLGAPVLATPLLICGAHVQNTVISLRLALSSDDSVKYRADCFVYWHDQASYSSIATPISNTDGGDARCHPSRTAPVIGIADVGYVSLCRSADNAINLTAKESN